MKKIVQIKDYYNPMTFTYLWCISITIGRSEFLTRNYYTTYGYARKAAKRIAKEINATFKEEVLTAYENPTKLKEND